MRRALRISAWSAAVLLLTILLAGGALMIAGNTDSGRTMLERLTFRLTSGVVSLSGLNGTFPQDLTVAHLRLSDHRGVWLSAEKVSVRWSPLAFLARRIQIDAAHAASVDMARLPESAPVAHRTGPVSIPRIDVANLTVDLLKLGPELAGAPASLVLSGNAHLRTVEDMIIDANAHRIDGDGEYTLHLRFDPKRMDAVLALHEPAGGPLENIVHLPGLGALVITASLNGLHAAEQLDVSVDAGSFRGRVQGSLNLSVESADLEFSIDSPAITPRPDLAWQRASVHGRWHGTLNAPRADARIEIDQLRVPGGSEFAGLNGDIRADSGAATLHALVTGLRIAGLKPQLLENSPVTIDASMRLDVLARPLDLAAAHRLVSVKAATSVTALVHGNPSVNLQVSVPDTAPFGALVGQKIPGSALIKAQVDVGGAATRLSLDANAVLDRSSEVWSAMVGRNVSLQLKGSVTDEALALDSLKFTGRALILSAAGNVTRVPLGSPRQKVPNMSGRWDLAIEDLTAVSPDLLGTLRASGALAGPITAFDGKAQLVSTLSVRDTPAGTITAAISMRDLPSSPSGTVVAHGTLDESPIDVDIAVEQSRAGAIRALIHRAEWKSVHVGGDISIAPAAAQSRGELSIRIGQLEDFRDLLGADVAGGLAGNVEFHSDKGRTRAKLEVDAQDLKVGGLAGSAQLRAEGVTDALGFKLDLHVPDLRGAKADVSAGGSINVGARKIALASAVANYQKQEIRLLSPAQITLGDEVLVDVLTIGAQSAVFQLKGRISPSLDLHASLRRLQPALVNVFVPGLLASGTIEARADLQGTLAAPQGQVRFTATDIRLGDDSALGLPSLESQVTAQLHGDTADIDASLSAGSGSKLSVTGRAPLSADGALDLKINGNLDVGMINPVLEARGQHASGQLDVDAKVAGSVAVPDIEGAVNLTKGSIHDYARGIGLSDITAVIVGREGSLEIKSFSASAAPGTVTMTGAIGVLKPGVPVDLKLTARNAQPIVSKLVTANVDADIHIGGTARERIDIAGSIHSNRTLIGIPNSLPPNVAVLDVRRRGKGAAVVPDKQLVVGLDLTVQAPQEILVQGRGLDAEMAGELHLGGTTDALTVAGGFDLQRGSFTLSSHKLNFTAGRVSFNGAGLKNRIDPTLDFTAETTLADTTATLRISGLADAPKFEFTSNPSLPQDEIMARLLFGTPGSQLSGLQWAQIGAALATLTGVTGDGSLNPLVKLQKSLGLDRLTVGAATNTIGGTENSGARVEAGRYISKRVYVEAKQSTTGTSQFEADVDLTKHLKLQTRIGNGTASASGTTPENDPGNSIGLSYQIEY